MNPYPTPEQIYGDAFPERRKPFFLDLAGRVHKVRLAEILPRIDQADPE